MYANQPGGMHTVVDGLGHGGGIIDGIGIGHATDGCKPTGSGCSSSSLDGFFVLIARFPEMDVQIHQTRRHNQPIGLEVVGM